MSTKKLFGDFQTPPALAKEVVALVDSLIGSPQDVVEPTAGVGAFLEAAFKKWGDAAKYRGFEINSQYVAEARSRLSDSSAIVTEQDFFTADWTEILSKRRSTGKVLVLGNPPWITNSEIGALGGGNLPVKSNDLRLKGMEARTGKSNFDIAEWMIGKILESLPETGVLALLCKTMTARRVLQNCWSGRGPQLEASLFLIDAKHHFDAAVDACLFFAIKNAQASPSARLYRDLSLADRFSEFGFVDRRLVSDIADYRQFRDLDGSSTYTWRSGIKHDASKVMELEAEEGRFINGLGEVVEIEEEIVYPLLKSSDLGNRRTQPRRHVIVTQKSLGEPTAELESTFPKAWRYLNAHQEQLAGRKSSIYANQPRFSIFGVGGYSFSPWKVAVSGFYKTPHFSVIEPWKNRPILLDDTCYFLACQSQAEANLLCELLNSDPCRGFIRCQTFEDSKRPITIDLLRRLSIVSLAERLGRLKELEPYLARSDASSKSKRQLKLVI